MAKVARVWNGTEWVELASRVFELDPFPSQTSNSGKFLTTNGTTVSWSEVPAAGNSFETISTPSGTSPVADSATDTLTLTATNGVSITGNSTTDSIEFSTNATSSNTASTIVSRDSSQSFDITAVDFDTIDTISTAVGRLAWDDGEGTLSVGLKGGNVNLQIGQESVALCYNGTGSSIPNGAVVYISGAQGQRPSITLADADTEETSSKTFGVATETIANGTEGFVATFGVVNGLDTSSFTAGQSLWLSSTAGGLTSTKPSAPTHSVFVGYCLHSHASSGRIFVNPQNGYELEELHNVSISSPSNNQALLYESSTGLWKNTTVDSLPSQTGNTGKFLTTNGTSASWSVIDKTTVGLSNVENTALSTWSGSSNITTVGTIGTGTWQGSTISSTYIDTAIARLASPSFTGTPTAPTATSGTNTTQIATTAYVRTEISNLVASAPSTLDTLNELATALGNDPNFATTVTNSLATKAPLASPSFTGSITLDSVVDVDTTSTTVNANTATTIDSVSATTYRSAEYLVQVTQGSKYTISKLIMIHNGTTANVTEYAVIELGASRIPLTVSATISGGNVLLQATITDAASTNATVKVVRSVIVV